MTRTNCLSSHFYLQEATIIPVSLRNICIGESSWMMSLRFDMEKYGCTICRESFDKGNHRPRALPCGHGFCTKCIQDCITSRNTSCPVCRAQYRANVATDLPVNFLLEDFLQNITVSAPQIPTPAQLGEIVMCPKHRGVPLYFYCKSHLSDICHSCAVIDHPPTSCKIISFEDKMNEIKDTELETIQKGIKGLKDTEKALNKLYKENDEILILKEQKKIDLESEVQSLLTKIEQTNQEINETNKIKENLKNSIACCQNKQLSMHILEANLCTTTGNQEISVECTKAKSEIMKIKNWEDELKKKFKLNRQYAQVERYGIIRSSKTFNENNRTFIPSLSKEIKLESSAKVLKEVELGLNAANTKVFLDLSAPGCHLGRVIINVQGDRSYGQQFIMLALATEGPGYKNAKFCNKGIHDIQLTNYVTETGSRANTAMLSTLPLEPRQIMYRGKLSPTFSGTTSFRIMTKDRHVICGGTFGKVIEGMDVVDRVFSMEFPITDVFISDCGIILNY